MTPATLDISVVICAYTLERLDDLAAAAASVARQSAPPRETIVVVDHNDELLDRACRALAGARVIASDQAPGLSGARNSGITAATGAVVAFLDDDALAAPDWLERLGAAYVGQRVLGVGGAIAPRWDDRRPPWFPPEFDWVLGCTYRGMPEAPSRVRNLIGANMSFRRDALEALGGFRPGLGRVGSRPLGGEETELCIRAQQRWPAATLLYDPRAVVAHRVPAARATWPYFRARCYAEGLSKASVSQIVGSGDGLAAERSYTLRTLPWGVAGGVAGALAGADPAGLARAGAIIGGLAITTAGYLAGTIGQLADKTRRRPPGTPCGPRAPAGG